MKKLTLLLILILSVMTVGIFGSCASSTHINDKSSSVSLSSQGPAHFALTVKPAENGTVSIGGNRTHAPFGATIDIYVTPDAGYEVVWVKINHGNRAEDKLAYFNGDIHSGVIRNLRVEYNMDIEAFFAPIGSIEEITHSYVGQPVSTSVQTHFKITEVACVSGSVSFEVDDPSKIVDGMIEAGTKVKVVIPQGYTANEIIVRETEDYGLIEVDSEGCFIMPSCNVAIMATFI